MPCPAAGLTSAGHLQGAGTPALAAAATSMVQLHSSACGVIAPDSKHLIRLTVALPGHLYCAADRTHCAVRVLSAVGPCVVCSLQHCVVAVLCCYILQ
jgi:hypothetical protein